MPRIDCVVIGAGVIGLAVARALAMTGREVIVIEREGGIGSGVSSRNSEVIHAGIYYPTGSLKALTCVEGRHQLYRFCAERGIAHRKCGKLIVAASDAQLPVLAELAAQAAANGVDDLRLIDAAELRALEPELAGVAALHSPSTGIVDSHAYMLGLLADAEAGGAVVAYNCDVVALRPAGDGIDIWIAGESEPTVRATIVVNAAGLEAQAIAGATEGLDGKHVPARILAKGSYFLLGRRAPFRHLVYPVPEPGGLGVHLTLDLAGAARFGPDVEWVDQLDYAVDPARAEHFHDAIRRYWPGLRDDDLHPGYAGIRPKVAGGDFVISGPADHGVPGLVNLFGIESPGLTASLAIAERTVAALGAM